ncbi:MULTISPECIES: QueT transporter family protein [unclassified Streptococcus]|uniref:QueT transporter family protein n=1 Tax=unclassified Streptococcus TaxID=2608887 RepID=UPI001072030A|nr:MULTISPECIES: QueT transporter family protein [unclassified Streptococcus]MBF0788230.1 QueT transporter family protein [Streptococcus sp. 19428wC2_LYSM12]MCQ9212183.1 QueT transporter family protein [Streptococcus sp. B01]MCQ9213513.1 QueT transporter family protein [Streptococcus sp. O1]TFV04699.1 queuosine transporter QueT [Streptococcus sp. LYSM12]
MNQTKWTVRDMAQIALVAALYMVLTVVPPLNAIAYGPYQFRLSEMLNFLAFYNRKYLVAVTIGCMISNLIGFGVIDVFVGGGSTLVFVTLGVYFLKKYQNEYVWNGVLNKAFLYFSIFFSMTMFTIALELHVLYQSPFLVTWFTTAAGEFASLIVGSLIIDRLAQRIDFTK